MGVPHDRVTPKMIVFGDQGHHANGCAPPPRPSPPCPAPPSRGRWRPRGRPPWHPQVALHSLGLSVLAWAWICTSGPSRGRLPTAGIPGVVHAAPPPPHPSPPPRPTTGSPLPEEVGGDRGGGGDAEVLEGRQQASAASSASRPGVSRGWAGPPPTPTPRTTQGTPVWRTSLPRPRGRPPWHPQVALPGGPSPGPEGGGAPSMGPHSPSSAPLVLPTAKAAPLRSGRSRWRCSAAAPPRRTALASRGGPPRAWPGRRRGAGPQIPDWLSRSSGPGEAASRRG